MLYNEFQDLSLSRLGFGTMRLPLKADGSIDEEAVFAMTRCAMDHGINYFDTAYPYHGGLSEVVIGRALAEYPRDSWYLASKYPGHQLAESYDPAEIFEEQLKKCGVEYFDFYLLHNVYEKSIETYLDPRWGIVEYFIGQKRRGRIRHLGFSSHGSPEVLNRFLDAWGEHMEFCQIQLNYLDWTLQDARSKCALLEKRGIPVWVMEPVRGGKLAKLPETWEEKLRALRPEASTASWCFRWLQALPQVKMTLSGMSSMEQMVDNVSTYESEEPLTAEERDLLAEIARDIAGGVPCTACRYCCDGCPMGLDIPGLLAVYNDLKFQSSFTVSMRLEGLPEEKLPAACIGCGACAAVCPQNIDIPGALKDLCAELDKLPKWTELCRQREEEARRLRMT